MTLRNIVLLTGLAGLLGGCVVAPDPHYYPEQGAYYDNGGYYDDGGYYDYHTTPSYEGYYYARIIFLGNIPYYVDDDRRIRPIPPRLYDHFRNYSYRNGPARAPVFSPDREVRDGYSMSRIIYFNDTPYYVGDDRAARPVPNNLRDRFRYTPYQNNAPMYGNRQQPPMIRQNEPRNAPPAYGRDWDRRDPPAFDRDRNAPPVYTQGRDRIDPPAYGRGPRNGDDDGGYPNNPNGRMMAPPDREDPRPMPIMPRQALPAQQPEQRYNSDPHFAAPSSGFGGRMMPPGRDDSRQAPMPQQQPYQPPVQQNSGDSRGGLPFGGGRMNPMERPQPSGGNNRPAPDRRKPRDQQDDGNGNGNGRGFGNRRD